MPPCYAARPLLGHAALARRHSQAINGAAAARFTKRLGDVLGDPAIGNHFERQADLVDGGYVRPTD